MCLNGWLAALLFWCSVSSFGFDSHDPLVSIQRNHCMDMVAYSKQKATRPTRSPTLVAPSDDTLLAFAAEIVDVSAPQVAAPKNLALLQGSQGTSSVDCRPSEFQDPAAHKMPSQPKDCTPKSFHPKFKHRRGSMPVILFSWSWIERRYIQLSVPGTIPPISL